MKKEEERQQERGILNTKPFNQDKKIKKPLFSSTFR